MIVLDPAVAVVPTLKTTVALAADPDNDAGVKVAVTPAGKFSAVSATVPAYPPTLLSVSVAVPDAPRATVPDDAESCNPILWVTGGWVDPLSPPLEQAARARVRRAERNNDGR